MFATVARTIRARRARAPRNRVARVTHTLLFLAALAVPPGLRDACAAACCAEGPIPPAACVAAGAESAVAPTHGCGSCCGTIASVSPDEGSLADGSPATVADAADGSFPAGCCGGDRCGCLMAPRGDESAATPTDGPRPGAHAASAVGAVAAVPVDAAERTVPDDGRDRPPERPVRVLYGVWRN